MKRTIAILLSLTLALALFGCTRNQPAEPALAPQSDPAAPADSQTTTAEPEVPPVMWEYVFTTEAETGEYRNDDGVLLATVSYDLPRLTVSGGSAVTSAPPADMQAICDAFNSGVAELRGALGSAEELGADAQLWYNEMDESARANFPAYEITGSVETHWMRGDLLDVVLMEYQYWGGAHGASTYQNLHFDLGTGTFFTLRDLSDKPDKMIEELRWNVLGKIWESGQADWYFDDYESTIQHKDDFLFSLGGDGLTLYFDEYEIAPYAAGIPEFLIPYPEFSRFLNERGERLLDLSLADRCMGDYYEAEELWNWFEGGLPLDYDDTILVPSQTQEGSYDLMYSRVDVPGVNSVDDLRALLRTRFTDEVIDERLDLGETLLFEESGGKLYAMPAGRGDNLYIAAVHYTIEMNGEGTGGKVIATVHWQDYDEEKQDWALTGETTDYEMPFTVTDGGARFSAFYTIW